MLQLERVNDNQEALRLALEGHQAQVWTALPGIIESFNAAALTCTVQPAIKAQVRAPDGSTQWVALPLLLDCPVVFPRGGGCTLTFPVAQGDECLVVFASRCIDAWYTSGGVQVQSEFRMHDLSDGFALPGPFSQATKIANVSTTKTQLRSNDGSTYTELDPNGQIVNIVAPGGINFTTNGKITMTAGSEIDLTAPNTNVSGNISGGTGGSGTAHFNGSVTATGEGTFNGGHTVSQHSHSDPQGGSVGLPTG